MVVRELAATTAIRFAEEGANVIVADRDFISAERIVRRISDGGGKAHAIVADTSRPEDNERIVYEAISKYGRIDVAFLNAGVMQTLSDFADITLSEFDRVMSVICGEPS